MERSTEGLKRQTPSEHKEEVRRAQKRVAPVQEHIIQRVEKKRIENYTTK